MTNRRHFLGAAAATGAAMAAPSDVVRIGMIGLGGRGNTLMASEVKRVPNARVTHLCDVDQARLEKAQASAEKLGYGKVHGTDDMHRLLDDKEVDAVVIATPDHWHAPAAILACAAGKDVYVEKPVSHNLREGRLMIEAARKYNRVVQAGLQSPSRPSTIAAIELAHSGKLGKVLMAKAWNTQLRADIGSKTNGAVPPGVNYDT
jgi:predicted dehydrogenase